MVREKSWLDPPDFAALADSSKRCAWDLETSLTVFVFALDMQLPESDIDAG